MTGNTIIQDLQETKAQFARDDPAFLVLLAALLLVSTVRAEKKSYIETFDSLFQAGFSFVLGIHFWAFIKFLLYVIFVDLIGVENLTIYSSPGKKCSGWFSDRDWSVVRVQQAAEAQPP